ncbi:MAG: glutaredoxin domain-containing protein [Bacteroidota bacterium]
MDSRKIFAIVLFAVLGVSTASAEKMYKWVDKDGNVSYHDRPPADAGYRVEEKNLGRSRQSTDDESLSKVIEKYPVVLYSAADCASCDIARAYLQKRKIPFTEQNLNTTPEAQQEIKKKIGTLSAPTITIGTKVMKGYVESLLAGELDDVGYPKAPSPEVTTGEKQDSDTTPASE